jgi:hypothetical protein
MPLALSFSQLSLVVAPHLTSKGLLVIDELPDLLKIPKPGEKLVELTLAFREKGGRLLTTAQRNVPPLSRNIFTALMTHLPKDPSPR